MLETVGLFEGWWNSLEEAEKEAVLRKAKEVMDDGYSIQNILDKSIASSQYLQ